ncbi:OST3/OST6 family protein [Xylariaceae sp. FL0255]|nr:OST3/OST6 family protein [Xylariaceae sp. FL0255]
MRWLPFVLSCLAAFPGASLAAKKSSADVFQDFHAKTQSSAPLKLTDASYKRLTTAPRNYTAAVLLTALDSKYGCELCHKFQPEWDVLARSWAKGDKAGNSRLILAYLDFNEGRDTFMSLGLQSAPQLMLFEPTTGPHAVTSSSPYLTYDFSSGALNAETVADWIGRHLADRPVPSIHRPINYFAWVVKTVSFLGVAGALFRLWPYVLPFIQSRNVWAGISLVGILLFTSGHMYNQIRHVPYVAGDGRGGVSYFAPGFQSQYGLETQIVAFLYGLLSFATISLALKAPRTRDTYAQQFMIIAWGAAVVLLYSYLMSVFRIKNGGYPFSLFPFM